MIKKANASKLKEQQYMYFLQPKTDHQGNKTLFTDFGCIGFLLLKRPYQTIICYENSERTKRKSFISWDYIYSLPDNPNPTYKQHHKNGNLTPKSS